MTPWVDHVEKGDGLREKVISSKSGRRVGRWVVAILKRFRRPL